MTTSAHKPPALSAAKPLRPLKGVRILSLALNLPGPAALMRCRDMGCDRRGAITFGRMMACGNKSHTSNCRLSEKEWPSCVPRCRLDRGSAAARGAAGYCL